MEYVNSQCDAYKNDSSLVKHIISKMIKDKDSYVYVKQRKSMQDDEDVLFDILKQFLSPYQEVRQATEAARKLQNSHCDGNGKENVCNKYVTLQKIEHRFGEP